MNSPWKPSALIVYDKVTCSDETFLHSIFETPCFRPVSDFQTSAISKNHPSYLEAYEFLDVTSTVSEFLSLCTALGLFNFLWLPADSAAG